MQTVVPVLDWYLPAAQLVQLDDPVAAVYKPASQLVHALAPDPEYNPTAQLMHVLARLAPTADEYRPAAH